MKAILKKNVQPLNPVQLMLLQTFASMKDEQEREEVSKLLVNYYAKKLDDEIDKLYEDGTLSDQIMEDWSNEHLRTPYSLLRNENN